MAKSDDNAQAREKQIFLEALEIEVSAERARFLETACGGDSNLLRRIEELLAHAPSDEDTLYDYLAENRAQLAAAISAEGEFLSELGEQVEVVGDYLLIEEIGRGAMGVVFRAKQVSLGREVALKIVLNAALASEVDKERFRLEAHASAHLKHQNIVPIYEIGCYEGHDFYSMPYLSSGTLEQKMAQDDFEPKEAVELIVTVAHAVSAAHQQGVIHRDLKPANILLGEKGEPMVSDFGLARWLDRETGLTLSGQIMGTPRYMAPEMAEGRGGQGSTSIDIYALGAILYELLAKVPPFQGDSMLAVLKDIKEKPVAPLKTHQPQLSRDLEIIVLKCLEKKPSDRYRSAEALADDLTAWLENRPIAARATKVPERVWKWMCRRPYHAALLVVSLLFLLTLGIAGPLVAVKQASLRQKSDASLQEAEVARSEAESARAESERAADLARQQAQANRRLAYTSNIRLIETLNRYREVTGRLTPELMIGTWLPRAGEEEVRGWEWYYTYGKIYEGGKDFGVPGGVNSLHFSPFGKWLLSSGPTGTSYRDTLSSVVERVLDDSEGHIESRWSPQGSKIFTIGQSGALKIWDARNGTLEIELREEGVLSASWGKSEEEMVSLDKDGKMVIWRLDGKVRQSRKVQRNGLTRVAWSPDGKHIAAIGNFKEVLVWPSSDIEHEPKKYEGHTEAVVSLSWRADGRWLGTASETGFVRIFDVYGAQRAIRVGTEEQGAVRAMSWNPDGGGMLYIPEHGDQVIHLNYLEAKISPIAKMRGIATAVDWSADRYSVAYGNKEGLVQVKRFGLPRVNDKVGSHGSGIRAVYWNTEGTTLHALSDEGEEFHVDLLDGKISKPSRLRDLKAKEPFAWNPRSAAIAFGREAQGGVEIDVLMNGEKKETMSPALPFRKLCGLVWVSRQELLACSEHGEIELRATRHLDDPVAFMRPKRLRGGEYKTLSVSPNKKFAMASGDQQRMTLWSITTGEILFDHYDESSLLDERHHAWSADGRSLATANGDGQITFWELGEEGLKKLRTVTGHKAEITALVWHPSEERLASLGGDSVIRVWDTQTGRVTLTLPGQRGAAQDLRWGPEGRRLVSVHRNGAIHMWDATAGMLLGGE